MAQKIDELKNSLNTSLNDDTKPWKSAFDIVEQKTGVPRVYIFIGVTAAAILYLIFGYAAQLLCNVISVVYPAYISIRAIETSDKFDDTKWLTYWVMYAVFSIFEFFSLFLTNFIPFYFLLKCAFFIWCMLPIENNGAVIIYNRIIRPQFVKHREGTDQLLDNLTNKAKDIVTDVLNKNK
jgi:receptor expression-enhancing protein 5/6